MKTTMARLTRTSRFRVSCDSLVALGNSTIDGVVLFAKNSDRPANECQPLLQAPRRQHAPGARLRCTYIEIPQVKETARVIGSRPFWCWGFEHGLNEHGVAIGNHTVFTKDALSGLGLIGMDLVRLGLERASTAARAVEVITTLAAQYGQGGSGYHDKDWPYHNSFLIADRAEAYVVETSDRRWALRRVADVRSVSNHLSIGDDWDAIADGTIEHAISNGWWSEDDDRRFDFAAAYRDTSVAPEAVSSGRHQLTCTLLEHARGTASVEALKHGLRDHYGHVGPPTHLTPADPHYFSVCMHAEPVGTTTASMIARIPADEQEPLLYWASFGSPCVGAFVPLFIDADVPDILGLGGEHPTDASPWWQLKRLLARVECDWNAHLPRVRTVLDAFEAGIAEQVRPARLARLSVTERSRLMQTAVDGLLARVRRLTEEL
jgi:secernin